MKRQNLTYNQIFLNQFSLDYLLRSVTGYFQVCLDNTPYRFSGKLVYIYIVTYIMEEWAQYMEEIQSVSLTAQNFSVSKNSLMNKQDVFFKHTFNRRTNDASLFFQRSLTEVQTSIDAVKFHQSESRMHVIRDWYLATGNNQHIMYWSIFQISVIIVTSFFQVFCLRRLFRTTAVTPTSKPRA